MRKLAKLGQPGFLVFGSGKSTRPSSRVGITTLDRLSEGDRNLEENSVWPSCLEEKRVDSFSRKHSKRDVAVSMKRTPYTHNSHFRVYLTQFLSFVLAVEDNYGHHIGALAQFIDRAVSFQRTLYAFACTLLSGLVPL